jgi:SAM-dependent methyltransferase
MHTNDYYDTFCQSYHKKTFFIDPSSFLIPLAKNLSPNMRVLDVGCGSGRDLLWLKNRGYEAIGFDRSPGLVRLSRKYSGCHVIEGDFEQYDFSSFTVDALIMIGALVHFPHENMPDIFEKIIRAVSRNGYILISFKEGIGKKIRDDGRIFYLWQDKNLQQIFHEKNCTIISFFKQISSIASNEIWLGYVLEKTI